jgi:hypothetical protein
MGITTVNPYHGTDGLFFPHQSFTFPGHKIPTFGVRLDIVVFIRVLLQAFFSFFQDYRRL